jgi:hypothetical protein
MVSAEMVNPAVVVAMVVAAIWFLARVSIEA